MALDKQIHLYSLDTTKFYTDEEYAVSRVKMKSGYIIKDIKEKQEKYEVGSEKYLFYKKWISRFAKINLEKKNELKELVIKTSKDNLDYKTMRKLNYRESKEENFLVSEFESSVTRSLGIKTNEITDDIMIIKVYYFDLFEDLLKNGFMHNGNRYIYYSSSAGQIRTKKAVFLREDKLNEIRNKLTCGLTENKINERGGCNINKFLAYTSLSNSATELWGDILENKFDIDRCVVIDDFETNVNTTYDYVNSQDFSITRLDKDSLIPHMDGCGIIDSNICKKNFMIRMPWVKGLLGSFDFKEFILVNNCNSKIIDIYGKEYDVIEDDIQVILTKSQFKMYKYYDSWDEYKDNFKKYNCECGICKIEDDKIRDSRINYQMLQTLTDVKESEMKELIKSSQANIKKLSNDFNSILGVFGVHRQTELKEYKSNLQNALNIYPELMQDPYIKDTLYDIKKSMIKKYRGGKIVVKGKYLFIVPDLYAVCQWIFMGEENPSGLIHNGEVSCRMYSNKSKLDLLRAPHLYREHAVRKNIYNNKNECKKWFNTNAIYISTQDPISKILMFDVDGDMSLVVSDENFIKIAERNMKGIVPLLYDLKKAEPQEINSDNKYIGLTSAFRANIGTISNNITKVWNSEHVGEKELDIIKWLCAMNNAEIDYAKTLWRPTIPKEKEVVLKKYVKENVPYFFIWAKDKKKKNVRPKVEGSTMYRIYNGIKDVRLTFKCFNGLDKINYKLMLGNNKQRLDSKVSILYDKICLTHTVKIRNISNKKSDDIKNYQIEIKEQFRELGYNDKEIADILTIYLYRDNIKKIKGKQVYWYIYGDIVVNNLKNNLDENTMVCTNCGKRANKKDIINEKCEECRMEIKNTGIKTIICIDCGKEFEVNSKNTKTRRCKECEILRKKEIVFLKNKKYYDKIKIKTLPK